MAKKTTMREKIRAAKREHDVRPKGGHDKPAPVEAPPVEGRPGYRNHFPKGKTGGRSRKVSKNHEMDIARRELLVAQHYLRGLTQMEVVAELAKAGIAASQPTVSKDIDRIMDRWSRECVSDFERQRLKEVQGLNHLEAFAWEELEFSRQRTVKVKPKPGETEESQEVRKETIRVQASVQWHEQIRKVKEDRVKLLGLVKLPDVKNMNTVNIVDPNFWSSMTEPPSGEDPIEAKIESVRMLSTKEDKS